VKHLCRNATRRVFIEVHGIIGPVEITQVLSESDALAKTLWFDPNEQIHLSGLDFRNVIDSQTVWLPVMKKGAAYSYITVLNAPRTITSLQPRFTDLDEGIRDSTKSAGGSARSPDPQPETPRPPGFTGLGTGFFVSADGLVLTAHHVVDKAKVIKINLSDGSIALARVKEVDPPNDLALLTIEKETPAHLSLAGPRSARLGQKVFTIGFPAPDILGQEPKYTDGTISSLSGLEGTKSLLQISVPVQPGNSGGPLVNENGEVVGIITSTVGIGFFLAQTGSLPQNVNWAIKSEYAKRLFDQPDETPTLKNRD